MNPLLLMRAFVALLLLVVAGPATHGPSVDAHPAIWAVRDADTTIYLFGTVHVLQPELQWFQGDVRDAFDRSDTLVLELADPASPATATLMTQMGMNARGPALPDRLPPETRAKLLAALDEMAINQHAFDRFEPWLAASALSVLPLRRLGYNATDGAEVVLARAAAAAGKPVLGLETPQQQLGYFAGLSSPAQLAMLTRTIDEIPRARAEIEETVAAWGRGDAEALGRLVNEDIAGSPELAQSLVVTRNDRWAQWIARRMAVPGTVFVAVGAGHLAGSDSLQAVLAKHGLRAERVDHPPATE